MKRVYTYANQLAEGVYGILNHAIETTCTRNVMDTYIIESCRHI